MSAGLMVLLILLNDSFQTIHFSLRDSLELSEIEARTLAAVQLRWASILLANDLMCGSDLLSTELPKHENGRQ
jgi:hypothetical protein